MGFLYVLNVTAHPVRVTAFQRHRDPNDLTIWLTSDPIEPAVGEKTIVSCDVSDNVHQSVMIPVALKDEVTFDVQNRVGATYELYRDSDGDTIIKIESFFS